MPFPVFFALFCDRAVLFSGSGIAYMALNFAIFLT